MHSTDTGGSGQGVIQIIQKQQRESRLASGQAQQGQIAAQRNATQQAAIAARSASAAQASQDRQAAIASRNVAVHHAREKEVRIAGEATTRETRAEAQRRMAEAKVSEAQTKAAKEQRMSKPRRQTKAEKVDQRIKAHKAATSRINAVTNAHKNIKPKSAAEKVADDAAKGIEL